MKKFLYLSILFYLSFASSFAQTRKTAVKTPAKPIVKAVAKPTIKPTTTKPTTTKPTTTKPIQVKTVAEITVEEWKTLAALLAAEDWEKSASLSLQLLNQIKIDNEKKQLAQLRYFYLYALAGKILKSSTAKSTIAQDTVWDELIRASARFTGKEFVLPPRRFLSDCKTVVNYICTVKDSDKALRTTATNKNGTEIHSFDYVLFDEKINPDEFTLNEMFLGGVLEKAVFNENLSKPCVMRLIFDKGFVRVADSK